MKKDTKKFIIKSIFILYIFTFIFLRIFSINVFAAWDFKGLGPDILGETTEAIKIRNITSIILGLFQFIAFAAAVIMVIYTGILYFTKSSKPDDRAALNEKMKSILIGFIFVVGAFTILTFIKDIVRDTATKMV